MDVLTVAAVLSLLSVSAAKPLNCEDLVKPLVLNKTEISGKWIFIQGTADHQKYTAILKTVNSSLMDVVLSSHNGTSVLRQRNMMNGKCYYSVHNTTFSNSTFHALYENGTANGAVLPAYPDCLVLSLTSVDVGDIIKALYVFGRTRKLSDAALEMYQKQVECLGFPQPSFIYDGKQDICPDEEKPAGTGEVKHDHKQSAR
ncbi:hypothetical protein SKAU_G00328340 [Synaphobranchus kaupii]|uniref:Lipocalin/cytosolic fatty-acid binding domain-containing protein n=1 Tax=Synaphobranchus kaupii TaxID=118154 RepID=A0A9Q1EQ95_SYNKA|nr:hypothetical protein SKAU_G00328340 [Synaphobranchus kaupii]